MLKSGYDIVVVGGGHAGIEACLATARLGCRVLLVTHSRQEIGRMPCNPAIGGLGKGHLVTEIDVLGGEMARSIDETGIQFRLLNRRKGPAVRSSRAQADSLRYSLYMRQVLEEQQGLDLKQAIVDRVLVTGGAVEGVETQNAVRFPARAVILTTGTFLRGLMHVGLTRQEGGRAGDVTVKGLSESLESLGVSLGRLKTGTPARPPACFTSPTCMTPRRKVPVVRTTAPEAIDPPLAVSTPATRPSCSRTDTTSSSSRSRPGVAAISSCMKAR